MRSIRQGSTSFTRLKLTPPALPSSPLACLPHTLCTVVQPAHPLSPISLTCT